MPPEIVSLLVIALCAAGIVVLIVMHRRNRAAVRLKRSALFARTYELFDAYRVTQDRLDYPILTGEYRGCTFHIDAVVDTLTVRKLPVLWLRVSLLAPLPGMAALDILVRSQNVEFYSPANDLAHQLRALPGWPADAIVRTNDPARAPDLLVINRHMGVFDRAQTKELLITEKGVRLVHMQDQGRRAEYLVLRQAEFEHDSVDQQLLRDLMDRTISLHQDLTAADNRHD